MSHLKSVGFVRKSDFIPVQMWWRLGEYDSVHCTWLHSTIRASQDFVSGRNTVLKCISMKWIKQKLTIASVKKWTQIPLRVRWFRKIAKSDY